MDSNNDNNSTMKVLNIPVPNSPLHPPPSPPLLPLSYFTKYALLWLLACGEFDCQIEWVDCCLHMSCFGFMGLGCYDYFLRYGETMILVEREREREIYDLGE